jgi:hypothetical protein
MTPIQGDWNISSVGLPASVLRKIYFDNASKLLARSLPRPALRARRISQDFELDKHTDDSVWQTATPVLLEKETRSATARPELSTTVRALWSGHYLYLDYECPFTKLTVFDPPQSEHKRFEMDHEGVSLWDRDVIEAFINANPENHRQYSEFEVAPTNERLDLMINLPGRDFDWSSKFESLVRVDKGRKIWTCQLRIPLAALSEKAPSTGTRWGLNLFRCDRANKASLAWNPTLSGTFHEPERFGVLEFAE